MRDLEGTQKILSEVRQEISKLRGRLIANAFILGEATNNTKVLDEFDQAQKDCEKIFEKSMEVYE
jgi:hypothetical protein|tara:strand:- start:507 stop:701 length:195 start_codon:yes stop_codon:yes gene_type:complete